MMRALPISSSRILGAVLGLLGVYSIQNEGLASTESDAVMAQYGDLEWIGGMNMEEVNNGNGWLPEYEGLPATEVNLSEPHSALVDLSGNVLVADKNANAIRLIDKSGIIRTVAGTGTAGSSGDGPATERHLNGPQNAYPMPDGSFYILDTGNRMIRHVSTAGQMTTVMIENNGLSRGLWVKRDHSLIYYCTNTALKRWTPSMGTSPGTVMADNFSELGNIDVAENGDVYLTDRGNLTTDPTFSKVFRIIPTATPATYAPVVVAGTGGSTDSGPGSSGQPATTVGIRGVRGIGFHPMGGYFLATHKGGDVWYVDKAGIITMIIRGDDANANAPSNLPRPLPALSSVVLSELRFVSVALNGDLLIATNDSGYILRARYKGPLPAVPPLSVTAPAVAGGSVKVEWTQSIGAWHRLESTVDPASEEWRVDFTGPGVGYPQTWTDPVGVGAQPRRFYRLRAFRNWPN